MNPRVSICIPTYNQGRFIRECVESALNQTFQDIEVVISVNHCTDDTDDILKTFSDPRLKIIRPEHFLIGRDNFFFCVSKSCGAYFSYLCSDDLLLPEFVESQIKYLDKYPNVDFVHCAAERIDENGEHIRLEKAIWPSFVREGSRELKRYIGAIRCVGDACLIRRSAYDAIGGDYTELLVDWELSLRLLQHGDVAYNEMVLMKYRDWRDEYRAGERAWKVFMERIVFYDRYQPEILQLHPEWLKIFLRARRKTALSAIPTFMASRPCSRREIKKQICRLSNSKMVKIKIFLVTMGLGFIWREKKCAIAWLRKKIKPIFYSLRRKEL